MMRMELSRNHDSSAFCAGWASWWSWKKIFRVFFDERLIYFSVGVLIFWARFRAPVLEFRFLEILRWSLSCFQGNGYCVKSLSLRVSDSSTCLWSFTLPARFFCSRGSAACWLCWSNQTIDHVEVDSDSRGFVFRSASLYLCCFASS